MTCYQARTLLGAYLDGEVVDLDVVKQIEAHLSDGGACAEDLQALQELITAVRERATYFKAPEGLAARIRARAEDREL
jgi:predicted anti-sigma-YlaC factor YlaD